MQNRTKQRAAAFLLLVSIILSAAPLAFAVDVSSITISNDPNFPVTISVSGTTVRMDGIPEDDEFAYIWFFLSSTPAGEDNVDGDTSARQLDGGGYYARHTFNRLRDGVYYLQIYTNSSSEGAYTSYIFKGKIPVNISGGAMSFTLSPTLENNLKISAAKREDFTALDYYRLTDILIQSQNAEILSLASMITSGISVDYEKARALHDWVCNNIYYDNDRFYGRAEIGDESATATLTQRRGMCNGFSNLYAALLRSQGIPAKVVLGYALGTGEGDVWTNSLLTNEIYNHSWNEVFIDNRWVIVDTTWDTVNTYENGRITDSGGLLYSKYFDPTQEFFATDHMLRDYTESRVPAPPSDWAAADVSKAYELGLVTSNLRSSYQKSITRSEFSDLIVRFIEVHTDMPIAEYLSSAGIQINQSAFTDTNSQNVLYANALGIILGYGNGIFDPNGNITREQAATMLYRTAFIFGYLQPNGAPKSFKDADKFSSWSANEIVFVSSCVDPVSSIPLMQGTSADTFSPTAYYTREQAILTILRLYRIIESA